MLRKISHDRLPGFAKVGGFVDERIAIAHQVKIDAHISGPGIKEGRRDAGDRSQWRQSGKALGHIRPSRRAVSGVPDLAIVGPRPDQTLLDFRGSNSEDDFAVELTEVVAANSSRGNDVARILC